MKIRMLPLTIMLLSLIIIGCAESGGDDSDSDGGDSSSSLPAPTLVPSAGEITRFLWKPQSDGGYNHGLLSILVSACNARIMVNGDELVPFGPGNGFCTTGRNMSKSGCAYGANARVQVFDRDTGAIYLFPGGAEEYIIPNGCNRVEFQL